MRPTTGYHRGLCLALGTALSLLAPGWKAAQAQSNPGASELVVYAAASLREPCTELARSFEAAHPGVRVRFNFAGSQELRTQLEHGAAADVFISADRRQMEGARAAGLVDEDVVLVTNSLALVVPAGNPAGLKQFAELPAAKRLVVGAAEVPVGAYTEECLERASRVLGSDFRARVEAHVVSRELNVKQVLTKVVLGEADAGIVYRSDAVSVGAKVEVLAIPPEFNVLARYPMAVLRRAPHPELARGWLRLLTSPAAEAVFSRAGFGPPAAPAAPPRP
jgi:molybdate transport system substrate-binding protein